MRIYRMDPNRPDPEAICAAAEAIRNGELVVFPTETVYGLAADALNEAAVTRVYDAKGRSEVRPLPVQIAEVDDLARVASEVPEAAAMLAARFWPGPLTLVLPRSNALPDLVSAGGDTVGVRIPDHTVALALIREVGSPIVATSANVSGRQPPTSIGCAIRGFGNLVSVALDAGECRIGVASTVVDVSVRPPRILRHGAISVQEIRGILGEVDDRAEET